MTNTSMPAPFVSEYTRNRKDFGSLQIKSPSELRAGRLLFACNNIHLEEKVLVKILTNAYPDRQGRLHCEALFWSAKTNIWNEHSMYLEDRNIVAYQNGTWNPYSWLERRFKYLPWI